MKLMIFVSILILSNTIICRVLTAEYPHIPVLSNGIHTIEELVDYLRHLKTFTSVFARPRFGKRQDSFEDDRGTTEFKMYDPLDNEYYEYEI
jgi:3'-phosphoadenosine 5'-phosphosulfate (PAPS) 3'-phosphatase